MKQNKKHGKMKYYFLYTKIPGQKQYHLTDIGEGVQVSRVMNASMWSEPALERNLTKLMDLAKRQPSISFQIREERTGRVRWSSPDPRTK